MAKSAKKQSAVKTVNPNPIATPIRLGNVGWSSKSVLFTGGTPISHFTHCVSESSLDEKALDMDRVIHVDDQGNVRNARSQSIVQLANTRGKLELEIVSCRSVNTTKAKAQDLNASELDIHDYIVFKRYLSAGSAKKLSNTRTPFFFLDLSEGIPTLQDVSFKVKESPFYGDFKKRVFEVLKESSQHLTGNDMTCMVIYPLVKSTGRFIASGDGNYSVIMSTDPDEYKAQVDLFRQYVDLANALGYKKCKVVKSIVEDAYDAKQELRDFIGTIESEVEALVAKKNRVEDFEAKITTQLESLDSLSALMEMQNEIKEARLNKVRESLKDFRKAQLEKSAAKSAKSTSRKSSKAAKAKAELEAEKAKNAELEAQMLKMREEFKAMMEMMKNQK